MKLSDYVATFLASQEVRHVFAVIGGASLHLIDSLAHTPGTSYICPQHEQAGAMAADSYARVTGNLGAAVATSGPGATNLMTGIACSYFDSVPVLYITGQVTTFRLKRNTGVRQMGFQETDVVDMCKPITKYAVMVEDPNKIRYELEKAAYIARSGRPGPVLVDIPDDLQRGEVDPSALEPFRAPGHVEAIPPSATQIDECLAMLVRAERPVVIVGAGVRLSKAEHEARQFVEQLGFPVLPTWGLLDLLPSDHRLVVGAFGTHGTRYGNFTVQNADLVLTIGARLDTREAGTPYSAFARSARKIVVDIDPHELGKFSRFGMDLDLAITADAREFLRAVNPRLSKLVCRDIARWLEQIEHWRASYPICPPEYLAEEDVNPYAFVKFLSEISRPGDLLCLDTGCALAWACQSFAFKQDQRLIHAFNTTAMGYALPAAIGASFANDHGQVTCVAGDGSLQMNIQELATVMRHKLPIKIFLLNNHGYSMVQQTQEQWLDGRYEGTTVEGGLAFPDWTAVAKAYGFPTLTIDKNADLPSTISRIFDIDGPVFCNVELRPQHRVVPQVRFGRPLEDPEPFLERDEFIQNMIVEPLEVSVAGQLEPATI
jgi:acetolactate synthase-1/2/3 large subunit